MGLEVAIKEEPGYLAVTLSGEYSLAAAKEIGSRVHVEALGLECRKVLIDARQVRGKVGLMDRLKLGAAAAMLWRKDLKVALVYRAEEMDGFFERSARHRGVRMRSFADMSTAREWLLAEESTAN